MRMPNIRWVLLLAALPFVTMWSTTASLAALWSDPLRVELSHGYLTLIIVAWLLWRRRDDIAQLAARADWRALVVLALLSVLWLVLWRASVQVGHQMLLPALCVAAIWAACGWPIARLCLFPLGYLYLAMPFWTVLSTPLQWGSVLAVRGLLRLVGIPAYFSGTTFEIPAGVFEIEDGCSGLRLMLVGLAISILYGDVQRATLPGRLMLVAIGAALSAFANWLRILIIIGAGHFYGLDHPLVMDHVWFGWVVFAGAMIAFFWIANRLPLGESLHASTEQASIETEAIANTERVSIYWVLLAGSMLSLGPLWSGMQQALHRYDALTALRAPLSAWQEQATIGDWHPKFVGADRELAVNYLVDARRVELYAAQYREQRQGRELLGYQNSIFGDASARILNMAMDSAAGAPRVGMVAQSADRERWLYWYSYRIGGRWVAKPWSAQLRYGLVSLWRIPESQVLIARTRCEDDACRAAAARLEPLWDAAVKTMFVAASVVDESSFTKSIAP